MESVHADFVSCDLPLPSIPLLLFTVTQSRGAVTREYAGYRQRRVPRIEKCTVETVQIAVQFQKEGISALSPFNRSRANLA